MLQTTCAAVLHAGVVPFAHQLLQMCKQEPRFAALRKLIVVEEFVTQDAAAGDIRDIDGTTVCDFAIDRQSRNRPLCLVECAMETPSCKRGPR
jgi:hypothetical protein